MFDYTYIHLAFNILTLLSVTAVGLLGVWTAMGRGHWFVRVAIIGLLLSLLLLVPAYEPLIVFTGQLLVAVPVLMFAQRIRLGVKNRATWQFSLRDLLLLTLVIAALAATATSVPKKVWQSWDILQAMEFTSSVPLLLPWLYFLIFALGTGTATCLAAWVALGRCRLWKRLVALLVVFPLVPVGLTCVLHSTSLWPHQSKPTWHTLLPFGSRQMCIEEKILIYALCSLFLMVVWLGLYRALVICRCGKTVNGIGDLSQKKHRWLCWPARAGLLLLSLAILVPLAGAYWVVLTPLPVPQTQLPNPNGYTRIIELGKQLDKVNIPIPDFSDPVNQPKPQDFFDFAQKHGDWLVTAREAIDLPSLVPLRYDASDLDMDSPAFDIQPARRLARAMVAIGYAECLHGNYKEGTRWYVDTIRLGRSYSQGGYYIHWLAGLTIEGMGTYAIHKAIPNMTSKDREALKKSLKQIQVPLKSLEEFKQREDAWAQNAFGWIGGLGHYALEISGGSTDLYEAMQNAEARRLTFSRTIIIKIALENYREQHRHYPKCLKDLVPKELKEIPLDPSDDKPLRYRKTDKGYLLYGIGPNRKDDGGDMIDDNSDADDVRYK